ncbi:hypothetical protein LTR56_022464 [Elasticomyces elasticus]|nr:hypothetical protein LTR22_025085 [Elasticomyces elasticus]KAK3621954.1 hypothetical protein LTR56_022464 [Elasticomyces elasticus]KAK4908326.1 hypothetical protein LTR49_022742 [Elasticomyces elasticus]KAK5748351.1 hypothetical protein LTS12_021570 [Elasticomyces elasticus]
MKTTAFAASCLALISVVTANPIFSGGKKINAWKGGKDWKSKDIKDALKPAFFTSTYQIITTPDQVINGTVPTPGEPGAIGYYDFGINSKLDVICYDIVLKGVTGDYQSPAKTATHIHQAVKGASGPPRLAFPNPLPVSDDPKVTRYSKGCLKGPFTTGILSNGTDTAAGFTVAQIEANPAAFFCDSHTKKYVPGVVRGQLA